MGTKKEAYPHESLPVGRTAEDRERNAVLLSGYDYSKYGEALTGYTGQDLQRVARIRWEHAIRTRVGPRGNYKAGMAQLPDGRLMLATCRDNNETDPKNRRFDIKLYASDDLGLTWKMEEHTALFGKEPSLAALPDGTLTLSAQGGYFGPGAALGQQPISRSRDGGKTWETFSFQSTDYPRNIFVEDDGSLLMILAERSDWYGEGTGSPNLVVCRSKDGGKSWSASEGKVDWDWAGFGENAVIRVRDGRLIAVLRRQIPGTRGEGFEDTVITESVDDGKTWAAPRIMLPTARVHAYLTELSDGRLLCTYSSYHVPWGVSAVVSSDVGRTWDLDSPVQLSVSNGYWVGWAVTLQLGDGSLITSYATTSYREQKPEMFTCEVVRWWLP